jgi:hypothetical protein
MEISVRTIGEVYSLLMGDFGIELTTGELAELRQVLGIAIQELPPAAIETEEVQGMSVQEQDDHRLQINVGPFFWFLTREDSVELFQVLEDLASGRSVTSDRD